MSSAVQLSSRGPARRGFVLLVLAVLAGVLAMHALAPAVVSENGRAAPVEHSTTAGQVEAVHAAVDCSHVAGGSGHLHHANATCAAANVGAPYAPPALTAALDPMPDPSAAPRPAPGTSENGRAPPDLAELQLLRI
ncbi:DUF6153 family protein [Streptomyces griseobrunneus]|uniref:DUF6153 family protein n=1 Tax=Streptomyces microflavus TaxID=1919 RepID=UPI0038011408